MMTLSWDQSEMEYSGSSYAKGFGASSQTARKVEGTANIGADGHLLQLVDWEKGITQAMYNILLATLSVKERESLYQEVLKQVLSGALATKSLLVFASFDPHRKLVCSAVTDYLANRNYNIEDEFAGVDELIEILAANGTANRGAILAGLVSVGDRRINAVARAARHLLSSYDVKNFAGVHLLEIRSSSVEFCLDWLIELNQRGSKEYVNNIACALMLMVVHDERGLIEDLSENEFVGFKKSKILQTKTFESYYSEIRPILDYLLRCDGFETIIGKVIEMWDEHQVNAKLLREKWSRENTS